MSVVARDEFDNEVASFVDIPIIANSVARPTAAVALVLDESGSMLSDAGNNRTRISVLRDAANTFIDQLYDDSGITLVSFANTSEQLTDLKVAGPLTSTARNEARTEIENHGPPDNTPLTSIGAGLQEAADIYNTSPIAPDFDIKATVVFTDGYNTVAPDVDDVAELINDRVYAVGVADAANINNDTLVQLADDSGGYMLVTGAITQDDEFLLEKYFIQILAGVMNRDIIKDPGGWITAGQITRVPFSVTRSDIDFDAVALSRTPQYTVIGLETPDGTVVDQTKVPAGSYRAGTNSNGFRVTLPLVVDGKGHWEGKWNLLIGLRWQPRCDKKIMANLSSACFSNQLPGTATLPFEALVHTRSNLRLRATIDKSNHKPGSTLLLRALLGEYGQPLENRPKVTVTMTRPDRTTKKLTMDRTAPGEYDFSVIASQSGVYRFHVKAEGLSSNGQVFSREQLLTAVIGRTPTGPGTGPSDRGDGFICKMLKCLTGNKELTDQFLHKLKPFGIDGSRLLKCIEKNCREHDKKTGGN
jgi:hypothetical protein